MNEESTDPRERMLNYDLPGLRNQIYNFELKQEGEKRKLAQKA